MTDLDLLNQDMASAIDSLNINEADKNLLVDILYQERINKDRQWDKDAEDHIIKLLESNETTE
jgi:hypothetical protein